MNSKFSLKVIKQGQAQKVHVVSPGAGLQGQALVVQASDATRYQLSDIVTLSAPEKLQMKRVGGDLHIALPGGDVDAPDVVIQDYYNVQGASVQGQTLAGEWRGYTTGNLVDTTATATVEQGALASGKNWFSNLLGKSGSQSVGMAEMSASSVATGGTSAGVAGMSWGAVAGVGALGALALGGGGGGGGGGSTDTSPLGVIKAYASSGGTSAAPTLQNYKDAGVSSLPSINDALNFMNAVVAQQASSGVDSADKLNALANAMSAAYNKITAEANGTAADITDTNPTLADFASLGVKVADAIGKQTDSKSGAGNETLLLLDSAIGDLTASGVNTAAALKKLATTANDVMLLAKGGTASQTDADLISGLNALLGGTSVSSSNLAAIKAAITATDDTGTGVDSISALKTLVDAQVLKSYASTGDGSASSAPALQVYTDAGIKIPSSATGSDEVPVDNTNALAVLNGISTSNWQTALASALVKINSTSLNGKTSSDDITKAVQDMAHSYFSILAAADGDPTVARVTPSDKDYTNIGATVSTNANAMLLLNDYVGSTSLKTAGVDTVGEINAVAKAAYNIMRLADPNGTTQVSALDYPASGTSSDQAWASGLNTLLGISTIDSVNNLAAVKAAIQTAANPTTGVDASKVDTVQEIQALVTAQLALTVLQAYANGARSTTPTLQNYKDAGLFVPVGLSEVDAATPTGDITQSSPIAVLNGISSANWLAGLNSALAKVGASPSKTALQDMVDSYYRILAEADGDATKSVDVSPNDKDSTHTAATFHLPKLTDYTHIGATVGQDSHSLALLNDYVGSTSLKTAGVDTVGEINAVAQAAYNVMRLVPTASGATAGEGINPLEYATDNSSTADQKWVAGLNTLLGTSTINSGNLAAVKSAIQTAGGTDAHTIDTVQELQALITPALSLKVIKDYASAKGSGAAPTLQNYKDIGVTVLGSLSDTANSTNNLSIDNATVPTALGTDQTTWLNAINSALAKETFAAADDKTKVAPKLGELASSYYRILAEADGDATKSVDVYPTDTTNTAAAYHQPLTGDYDNIGVTHSADAQALALLNDFVGRSSDSAVATVTQLNAAAQAAFNVMNVAKGLSAGATDPAVYATDGSSSADAKWVSGLSALGITGVTTDNIGLIKTAIADTATDKDGKATHGTGADTVTELQALVGLVRMKIYADNPALAASKTALAPSLADWGALVTAAKSLTDSTTDQLNNVTFWKNNTTGLAALNSALDTFSLTGTKATDVVTLQAIADSYGRILQEADGSRATETDVSNLSKITALAGQRDLISTDLDNIGVTFTNTTGATGFLDSEKKLLASAIGVLNSGLVDTVQELNDLAIITNNVMRQGLHQSVTYDNTGWISALSSLGITGANQNNIGRVTDAIDAAVADNATAGGALDSWDALQSIVSMVRVNDYAKHTVGVDAPVLSDYQAIMAKNSGSYVAQGTDVTKFALSTNVSAYNDVVYSHGSDYADSAVASVVSSYNLILALADGSRSSTPSALPGGVNYNTLLGTSLATGSAEGTTPHLLNDVIDGLANSKVNTVSQLTELEKTAAQIIALAGGGTVTDTASVDRVHLGNLGLTDGNGHSVSDWNSSNSNYWVTDAQLNYFLGATNSSTSKTHPWGSAPANFDTLSELQARLRDIIVNG